MFTCVLTCICIPIPPPLTRTNLHPPTQRYQIVKNEFLGFGQARTLSLQKAWQHFPQASHVMIADPDWRPTASTINFSELAANNVDVYRFTIYDRNGYTTRQIDWLLRHRQGLGMRYHLHEVLNIGYYSWADVSWVVHEVEQAGTCACMCLSACLCVCASLNQTNPFPTHTHVQAPGTATWATPPPSIPSATSST